MKYLILICIIMTLIFTAGCKSEPGELSSTEEKFEDYPIDPPFSADTIEDFSAWIKSGGMLDVGKNNSPEDYENKAFLEIIKEKGIIINPIIKKEAQKTSYNVVGPQISYGVGFYSSDYSLGPQSNIGEIYFRFFSLTESEISEGLMNSIFKYYNPDIKENNLTLIQKGESTPEYYYYEYTDEFPRPAIAFFFKEPFFVMVYFNSADKNDDPPTRWNHNYFEFFHLETISCE